MNFKKLLTAIIILIGGVFFSGTADADINATMDSMFNSMINVTAPDAVLSARRGVIDAGSAVVRNRIVNYQLLSFNPPKISAGCGGVDMFLGSFSYINADMFVNALRSIASNAISYAFSLALKEMCPSCEALMSKLQQTARNINSLANNSCQTSKRLVDTVAEQLPDDLSTSLETGPLGSLARNTGTALDEFNARFPTPGSTLPTKALTPAQMYDNEITGNVAYRVMTEGTSSPASWIVGNDANLIEELISLTGTIIIKPVDPSDPEYNEKPISVTPVEGTLDFNDFLNGGGTSDVTLLRCTTGVANCMEMSPVTSTTLIPMKTRVNRLLLGDLAATTPGIAQIFATNGGTGNFSTDQKALMELLPEVAKNIRDLSRVSLGAAVSYCNAISDQVSLMLVDSLIDELITSVSVGIVGSKHQGLAQFQVKINALKKEISDQKKLIYQSGLGRESVTSLYQKLMETNKKKI